MDSRRERATKALTQPITLDRIRERLEVLRADERARYDRAHAQRQNLTRIACPPSADEALASERREIEARVSGAAQLTAEERAQLARLRKEQQSWNPFARNEATKKVVKLHTEHRARYDASLGKAMRDFESGRAQEVRERTLNDGRLYRDYVSASLGLEAQMRQARTALRDDIPKLETQLSVLQRAGIAKVECEGAVVSTSLGELARSVREAYDAVPQALRRDLELAIRKERRTMDRTRASMAMDR